MNGWLRALAVWAVAAPLVSYRLGVEIGRTREWLRQIVVRKARAEQRRPAIG